MSLQVGPELHAPPYAEHRSAALRAQLHLPLFERTCPICGHMTMRVCHLWCGNCHAYSGPARSGEDTWPPLVDLFTP
ncbi:hypothetical protein [Streptomyces sp. NPDC001480]|uniref:hypothetical protein n=1 Tax=Streptomyces sp. NPDC001480 TaxID=3364577 RepID=UPI0036AA5984